MAKIDSNVWAVGMDAVVHYGPRIRRVRVVRITPSRVHTDDDASWYGAADSLSRVGEQGFSRAHLKPVSATNESQLVRLETEQRATAAASRFCADRALPQALELQSAIAAYIELLTPPAAEGA